MALIERGGDCRDMTELIPDPVPSPATAERPVEPAAFALDQRIYLFLVASAFLITGAALFFMALVDAPVTQLAILLLGIGALSALLCAASSFSGWRLARLAQQAGAARAGLLRASERRLAVAISALLLVFICATLGYGQDSGAEQDQAALWRHI
jgi:hypothetical protein